jgi:hypothetical protein
MAGTLLAAALVGGISPGSASAQGCTVATTGGQVPAGFGADACQKARDLFVFLAPQVGTALSGGNVMLGEGGTLGGWGKRSIVLRTTVVAGFAPDAAVSISGRPELQPTNFGAQRIPVPVPSLDVAIGLFRGLPLGITNVGGLDLLLGVTYLPEIARGAFSLAPQGNGVAATVGARVGLLQESLLVPGVAVSVLRRQLPVTSVRYSTGDDSLAALDTRIATTVFRVTAKKHLGLFGVGGGFGQDRHASSARIEAIVNETVQGAPVRGLMAANDLEFTTTRSTAFVNVSIGLPIAQLVLEAGQSRAGDIRQTVSTFGNRQSNEGYRYASLGVGLRF